MDRVGNYSLADASRDSSQNGRRSSGMRSLLRQGRRSVKRGSSTTANRHSMPPRYTSFDFDSTNSSPVSSRQSPISAVSPKSRCGSFETLRTETIANCGNVVLSTTQQQTCTDVSSKMEDEIKQVVVDVDSAAAADVLPASSKVSFSLNDNKPHVQVMATSNDVDDGLAVQDAERATVPTDSPKWNRHRELQRQTRSASMSDAVVATDEDDENNNDDLPSRLSRKRSQPVTRTRRRQRRSPPDPETMLRGNNDIKLNGGATRGSSDNMLMQLESADASSLFNTQTDGGKLPTVNANMQPVQNTNIINFEDDDMVEDCDADHGPFNDLERLKQRSAHFAVFLNYVLLSHEPQSLLFLIAVDSYKSLSRDRDLHKQADIVFKHFLCGSAPFKVDVDDAMTKSIFTITKTKNPSEDALKCMFDPAVQVCTKEIREQLSQYRTKREQGLGNMFGDEKLPQGDNAIDPQQEAKLVDEIISSKAHELQQPNSAFDPSNERLHVVQEILHGFVLMYGTKRKAKFDRVISFLGKPKPPNHIPGRSRMSTSTETINEDSSKQYKHKLNLFKPNKNKDNERKKGSSGKHSTSRRPTSEPVQSSSKVQQYPHHHHQVRTADHQQTRSKSIHIAQTVPAPSPPDCGRNGEHATEVTRMVVDASNEAVIHRTAELETVDPLSRAVSDHLHSSSGGVSCRGNNINSPSTVSSSNASAIRTSASDMSNLSGGGGIAMNMTATNNTNVRGSSSNNDIESLTVDTMTKKPSRSGSFRGYRSNEKRYGSKSHSDPDKDKVELAVNQHSITADVSEQHGGNDTISRGDRNKQNFQLPTRFDDPELTVQPLLNWHDTVPKSVRKELSKNELSRQQVINELLYTEQHHIRDLAIMDKLFYEPMKSGNMLEVDELKIVFPNLQTVLGMHRQLNSELQKIKENDGHVVKEIGDALAQRFDEEAGSQFRHECAQYCGNQTTSLNFIKDRCRKDQRFNDFLSEMQRHHTCRKLHLKDFIPMEFQRLTKYPLLLESIIKHTKNKDSSECRKIKKSCAKARGILAYANSQVKIAEDRERIRDIQQNLDRSPLTKLVSPGGIISEFREMDLLDDPAVHQGSLQFCIGIMEKKKEINMHVIVYPHVVVLLEQTNGKYVLKTHGITAQKGIMPPYIKMEDLIVRPVATDKLAFFMMASQQGLYQFVARTQKDKKEWMDILAECAEKYKKNRNNPKAIQPKHTRTAKKMSNSTLDVFRPVEDVTDCDSTGADMNIVHEDHAEASNYHHHHHTAEDRVSPIPTTTIMPILASNERQIVAEQKLRAKQEEINASLREKRQLLAVIANAELSNIDTVLEMSAADNEADCKTLVLHSLLCVDKLTEILNNSTIPENVYAVPSRLRNHHQARRGSTVSMRGSTTDVAAAAAGSSDHQQSTAPTIVASSEEQDEAISEATTGYNSESAADTRWAIPVEHPTSSDENIAADTGHVSTPDEVSELQLSEAASGAGGESERVASPLPDESTLMADPVDNTLYERLNSKRLSSGKMEETSSELFPVSSSTTLSPPNNRSSLLIDSSTVASAATSRPQSVDVTDLMAGTGLIPIDDVMDVVGSLQTQLTRLLKKVEQLEQQDVFRRNQGHEQTEFLDDNEPPPTYEELQDWYGETVTTPASSSDHQPPATNMEFGNNRAQSYRERANATTSSNTPPPHRSVSSDGYFSSSPAAATTPPPLTYRHSTTPVSGDNKLPSLRESEGESSTNSSTGGSKNSVQHRSSFTPTTGRATAF